MSLSGLNDQEEAQYSSMAGKIYCIKKAGRLNFRL